MLIVYSPGGQDRRQLAVHPVAARLAGRRRDVAERLVEDADAAAGRTMAADVEPGTGSLTTTSTWIHPCPGREHRLRRAVLVDEGHADDLGGDVGSTSSAIAVDRPTVERMYSSMTSLGRPDPPDPALVEPHRRRAQAGHGVHVVADEQHGAAAALDLVHLAEAATLELDVAHGEHLVDEQDLGLHVGGDGEAEAQVHARRVALDRRVHELLEPGEGDDLVEPGRTSRRVMPRMAPLR